MKFLHLFQEHYDYAPLCLKHSIQELKKKPWFFAPLASFSKKRRPLLVLDDVQRLFKRKEYEPIQEFIINSILIPIMDRNEAAIFLVTSDYSIEQDLRRLSGMSTRMKTFPFPKIGQKEFEILMKKDLENLQHQNKQITLECLLQYYQDFNTDLRSLNRFIEEFSGDYEGNY